MSPGSEAAGTSGRPALLLTWPTNLFWEGMSEAVTCALTIQSMPHLNWFMNTWSLPEATYPFLNSM